MKWAQIEGVVLTKYPFTASEIPKIDTFIRCKWNEECPHAHQHETYAKFITMDQLQEEFELTRYTHVDFLVDERTHIPTDGRANSF